MISLNLVTRTHPRLVRDMAVHYSLPLGFVGRNICYTVVMCGRCYGTIVGGSSILWLPGRDEFFKLNRDTELNNIVNNVFFHLEKPPEGYPIRNASQKVLAEYRKRIRKDWLSKYKDIVIGFESLVELPRTGEVYRRDGWSEVGMTKGYTCKRGSANGNAKTDNWGGQRQWDTHNLRPKRVFVRKV